MPGRRQLTIRRGEDNLREGGGLWPGMGWGPHKGTVNPKVNRDLILPPPMVLARLCKQALLNLFPTDKPPTC